MVAERSLVDVLPTCTKKNALPSPVKLKSSANWCGDTPVVFDTAIHGTLALAVQVQPAGAVTDAISTSPVARAEPAGEVATYVQVCARSPSGRSNNATNDRHAMILVAL
jgi:hypothetical protein